MYYIFLEKEWLLMKRLPRSFQFVFIGLIALTLPVLYQNCGQVKDSRDLSSNEPEESNAPEISVEIHNGDGVLIANGASLCGIDESEDNTDETDSTEDESNNDELNKVTTNESHSMEDDSNVPIEVTRIVHISVTVPSSASSYSCRRTLPLVDEEFWSCDEARSLDDVSSGSFSEGDEEDMSSDDTVDSTTTTTVAADSTTSTTSDATSTTTTTIESSTKQVTLSYENLSDETYEIEIYADGTDENGTAWTSSVLPVSFTVEDCSAQSSEETEEETTSTTLEEATTTTTVVE